MISIKRTGSWSVVTTALASEFNINNFVEYYLKLGADKVYVFFDNENISSFNPELLSKGLNVFYCSNDYWKNIPELFPFKKTDTKPFNIEKRQHINMLYARKIMSSEWLLHVDIDEYVYARSSIDNVLENLNPDVFSLQLKTLEAVYDFVPLEGEEFNTVFFKRYMPSKEIVKRFFGDISHLSHGGFWGVKEGKCFIRKTPKIKRMSMHKPLPLNQNFITEVETNSLELLHFESLSLNAFTKKMKGRFKRLEQSKSTLPNMFKRRTAYVKKNYEQLGDEAFISSFIKFNVFNQEKMKEALQIGFVVKLDWQEKKDLHINFNPINQSTRISNFQGNLLLTFHNRYLCFDLKNQQVRAITPGDLLYNSEYIPIQILDYDDFSILYLENEKIYYLSENNLQLVEDYNSSLKFIKKTNSTGISLFANNHFLCSEKDKVSLDRKVASDWERFYIKKIYPQISLGMP